MADARPPDAGSSSEPEVALHPGDPAPHDIAEPLGRSAASGVKWSFVGTVASQVARLLTAFALARILGPGNYGVVALAYIYLALVSVMIDQAFGVLVIQKADLTRAELATATTVNAGIAVVIAVATVLVAPFVSSFFHEPELTAVLRVLALQVVFLGLAAIPLGLLARRLRFAAIAKLQVLATTVSAVAAIAAAVAGAGYWALVVQSLVASGLILVGALLLAGAPVFSLRPTGVRFLLSFSVPLMAAALLNFFGTYSDNLLIGRFEGAKQLAYYALAYRLMSIFLDVFTGVISRVALPLFSRAQHDRERWQRGFLMSARVATTAGFVVLTLVVLSAPAVVPFALGQEWVPAVLPLQLLMAAASIRIVMFVLHPLVVALGRTDIVLLWTAIVVATAVPAFALGLAGWGVPGVAGAYLAVSVVVVGPNVFFVSRSIGLDARRFVGSVVPAAGASLVLAACWLAVDYLAELAGAPAMVAASVASVIGIGIYVGVIRWRFRDTYDECRSLAASFVGRGDLSGS